MYYNSGQTFKLNPTSVYLVGIFPVANNDVNNNIADVCLVVTGASASNSGQVIPLYRNSESITLSGLTLSISNGWQWNVISVTEL